MNRRTVLVVAVSCLVLLAGALVGLRLLRADSPDPVAAPQVGKRDPMHISDRGDASPGERAVARLTVAQTGGLVSTPWRLVKMEGRDLFIDYDIGSSSCDTDRGAYVKETGHRVLVGHYVYDTSVGNPCTADMSVGHGVVKLDKPLGKRSLWHVVVADGW